MYFRGAVWDSAIKRYIVGGPTCWPTPDDNYWDVGGNYDTTFEIINKPDGDYFTCPAPATLDQWDTNTNYYKIINKDDSLIFANNFYILKRFQGGINYWTYFNYRYYDIFIVKKIDDHHLRGRLTEITKAYCKGPYKNLEDATIVYFDMYKIE